MFGLFRKKAKLIPKGASIEAYELIKDFRDLNITVTALELQKIFLFWTREEFTDCRLSEVKLGLMIKDTKSVLDSLDPAADRSSNKMKALTIGEIMSKTWTNELVRIGLLSKKKDGLRITEKGEQVRQFLVLKFGLKGCIDDRSNRFVEV